MSLNFYFYFFLYLLNYLFIFCRLSHSQETIVRKPLVHTRPVILELPYSMPFHGIHNDNFATCSILKAV